MQARETAAEREAAERAESRTVREEDDDYDYSEEEEEPCTVTEGCIYTTPGVCQETVQGVVMSRGTSFLAQVVYGAPEA